MKFSFVLTTLLLAMPLRAAMEPFSLGGPAASNLDYDGAAAAAPAPDYEGAAAARVDDRRHHARGRGKLPPPQGVIWVNTLPKQVYNCAVKLLVRREREANSLYAQISGGDPATTYGAKDATLNLAGLVWAAVQGVHFWAATPSPFTASRTQNPRFMREYNDLKKKPAPISGIPNAQEQEEKLKLNRIHLDGLRHSAKAAGVKKQQQEVIEDLVRDLESEELRLRSEITRASQDCDQRKYAVMEFVHARLQRDDSDGVIGIALKVLNGEIRKEIKRKGGGELLKQTEKLQKFAGVVSNLLKQSTSLTPEQEELIEACRVVKEADLQTVTQVPELETKEQIIEHLEERCMHSEMIMFAELDLEWLRLQLSSLMERVKKDTPEKPEFYLLIHSTRDMCRICRTMVAAIVQEIIQPIAVEATGGKAKVVVTSRIPFEDSRSVNRPVMCDEGADAAPDPDVITQFHVPDDSYILGAAPR